MTKMQKICSVILCAAAVVSGLAAVIIPATGERNAALHETAGESGIYRVQLEGDLLAAYLTESGEVLFSGELDAAQISGKDRTMLEAGVFAGSLEEVLGVFEDFCS
jgi:hypothetical protein